MWHTYIKNDLFVWNLNLTGRLLFYLATLVKSTDEIWTCHLIRLFHWTLILGFRLGSWGSFYRVLVISPFQNRLTFISTCTGGPACLDRFTVSEQVMSTLQELHTLSCFHLATYKNLMPFCGHTELSSAGATLKNPKDSKASWTVGR